jgi:hypothetical protein
MTGLLVKPKLNKESPKRKRIVLVRKKLLNFLINLGKTMIQKTVKVLAIIKNKLKVFRLIN